MPERRISIKLEVVNEFNSKHAIVCEMDYDENFANVYNLMGIQVNNLMKVMGFLFFDKDTILMESVTYEEAELLSEYLDKLREQKDL